MNAFWAAVLGGVVRTVIATAGGYAVSRGTIDSETVTQVTGAAAAAAAGLWSIVQKVRSK